MFDSQWTKVFQIDFDAWFVTPKHPHNRNLTSAPANAELQKRTSVHLANLARQPFCAVQWKKWLS